MTNEPVAYRVDGTIYNNITDAEFAVRETDHLRKSLGIDNGLIPKPIYIEKLYTADQLQPRVKMTQNEFKEFMDITMGRNLLGLYGTFKKIFEESKDYPNLYKSFETHQGQIKFAKVWEVFDREHPEETIEIVPEKKWFVERNDTNDDHRFLSKNVINLDNELNYAALKKSAKQFVTKEQAEEWTNPLTEAVLLPVEELTKDN